MPSYPALLMVADGSAGTGYQGVLILATGPRPGDPMGGHSELKRCGHAHRLARTARECARRLGSEWERDRRAWREWKEA
jgi:hypothetical protein